MASPRTALREELSSKLVPKLIDRGFVGPRAISGNALFHDFKRPRGSTTHILSLQLEKHGLPRFLVNLCIEPAIGFDALVSTGGTVLSGTVRPRRGTSARAWFRADPTLLQRLLGRRSCNPSEAVAACLALLPEIDAWWETQARSKHISVLQTHYPGAANVRRA